MEKPDWSERTRAVVEPILESDETVLAMGTVEHEATNTGDRLFNGLPKSQSITKAAQVVLTSKRVMFVRTAINGGQIHTAVSAAPWGALTEVVNPKPLLAGQRRYLNFLFPSGVNRFRPGDGAVRTQFWNALVSPDKFLYTDPDGRQKAFFDNAFAIAQERIKAAHDAGEEPSGELLTTVALVARPVPGKAAKPAREAGPKAPGKGRWLPIVLWVLAAGALGFGAFCFIHGQHERSWAATAPPDLLEGTAKKIATLTTLTIASAAGAVVFIALGIALWVRGSRRAARAGSSG